MDTCPSYFNVQDGGKLCNRKERRKKSHTATCKKYERKDRTVRLATTGGCFRQCEPGNSDTGALCFPKAELRISIEMIFDQFQEVLEFIEGLPIGEYMSCMYHECIGLSIVMNFAPSSSFDLMRLSSINVFFS